MLIEVGNNSTTLLVVSKSACSVLNQPLAKQLVNSSSHSIWVCETTKPQQRTFSNEPIQIEGKFQTPVTSNGWHTPAAMFTVVANGMKPLIIRDLFDQLGLAVTQSFSQTGNQVNAISPHSAFKEHRALQFPDLITRIERSKSHVAKSKVHKNFQPRHQKERRTPNNLQDKVNNEHKKLPDEKHMIKLTNCPNKFFCTPILLKKTNQ